MAEGFPAAQALYDRANEVLDYDLAKLCFEGPAEQLNSTVHSQPALFVCSLAALEKLRAESPGLPANHWATRARATAATSVSRCAASEMRARLLVRIPPTNSTTKKIPSTTKAMRKARLLALRRS